MFISTALAWFPGRCSSGKTHEKKIKLPVLRNKFYSAVDFIPDPDKENVLIVADWLI
jgi:hypothetical protein